MSITYDFETKMLCDVPQSEHYKTIDYPLTFYQWFYVYENDFDIYEEGQNSMISEYISCGRCIVSESFEYTTPSNEFCNIYKYIYMQKGKPNLTLYKMVPYACDYVANPNSYGYLF
jgi:hypothetical protein